MLARHRSMRLKFCLRTAWALGPSTDLPVNTLEVSVRTRHVCAMPNKASMVWVGGNRIEGKSIWCKVCVGRCNRKLAILHA